MNHPAVFQRTIEKSAEWIHGMLVELGVGDSQIAYGAFRAGLHALRDRLTVPEAADLAAQLPMLIRGLFFEGWVPTAVPLRIRTQADLVARVAANLPPSSNLAPVTVLRSTLRVLEQRISAGEIADIKHSMPKDLRRLWPESPQL